MEALAPKRNQSICMDSLPRDPTNSSEFDKKKGN